ncbi:hypothetical protein FGIG_02443 [Fasciola gigantica]|uniref:Uncharacterized protein n=1 Tax=Fasciola gigantica TaxID=46835 RepID=A0A504YP25_FASGI|nr:hypothetical protein FGIG_02443 [Fasciola gigantica]
MWFKHPFFLVVLIVFAENTAAQYPPPVKCNGVDPRRPGCQTLRKIAEMVANLRDASACEIPKT